MKYISLLHLGTYCPALFLTACAGIGTPMLPDAWQADTGRLPAFTAAGRLSVKSEANKGNFASFDWMRGRYSQTININTPLGNTVGQLCRDTQGVVAENARGEIFQAANSEELAQQLTGVTIPLDILDVWALGYYNPQDSYKILPDGTLEQAGWLIHRDLGKTHTTPHSLTLSRHHLMIRIIFDTFDENTPDTAIQCPQRTTKP